MARVTEVGTKVAVEWREDDTTWRAIATVVEDGDISESVCVYAGCMDIDTSEDTDVCRVLLIYRAVDEFVAVETEMSPEDYFSE